MRHPFASAQYSSRALSADVLHLTAPERLVSPPPQLPPLRLFTPPPVPSRPPQAPPKDGSTAVASTHYVKHSSKVTILLSGQQEGISCPIYSNGDTLDGVLAVPNPSGVLSLDVKIEGHIRVREVAGAGDSRVDIIDETLFSWSSRRHATFPAKVSFRYTFPQRYIDPTFGNKYPLPPTYYTRLSGIPGFTVEVSYAIVVHMERTKDKFLLWQKNNSLRVPFIFQQLNYPARAGPFPSRVLHSPAGPQTLFISVIKPRRRERSHIETHLYLPLSQVCSLASPIPFTLTLFGDDESLEPYSTYRPSPLSFHPISPASNSSTSSLHQQLNFRHIVTTTPIRVQLQRRTTVNGPYPGSSMTMPCQSGHMFNVKMIGNGVVHSSSRGAHSITWSGEIVVNPGVRCTGFATDTLQVADSIVISMMPPDSRTMARSFCETIPVRLTTESTYYHSPSSVPEQSV